MESQGRNTGFWDTFGRGGIMESQLPPEFIVNVDHEKCRKCKRCVMNCSFSAIEFKDKVTTNNRQCVACHRCATFCPESAITITQNPLDYKDGYNWSPEIRKNILKQAESGGSY